MGVEITEEQAKDLKKSYMEKWPEMAEYFKYCSGLMQGADTAKVTFVRSGLVRDAVFYCAVCNGFFQHLAAMGAKNATYNVVKECFTGDSALFGCRPVLFLHDEIGIEIPDDSKKQERVDRLQKVMIESMNVWIPDVPITCEAVLMRKWYKGAEPVYRDGIIVPSMPKKEGKKTIWVPDLVDKDLKDAI